MTPLASLDTQFHFDPDWRLLILVSAANAMPIMGKNVFGSLFMFPLDGQVHFVDGQRLLGQAKTLRGIVLALSTTALLSPMLGVPWKIGLMVAAGAMAGDILSSFLKRRLRLPASSMAVGLDQIPESLFPMIVCSLFFRLTAADIACVVSLFLIGELLLSRLLFRLHFRDEPY